MGRSAQRRMLRRSGDLPAAQRLLLHLLSGLFSAGVVSRRLRRAGLQQLLPSVAAGGAGGAGIHRFCHALPYFEGPDDAVGGAAV